MRLKLQEVIAYLIIGFTAGYIAAAVVVARHWDRIP